MLSIHPTRTGDEETSDLCQYIDNIHLYLSQICAESEFQGLKYHGGPIAKCKCKSVKVLDYVSFDMKKEGQMTSDSPIKTKIVKCRECLKKQDIEQLLLDQVMIILLVMILLGCTP